MKSHIARKEHRCDACGRRIPVGVRYWSDYEKYVKDVREHTNCENFTAQPVLPFGFNSNRERK